ncbi:acetyl-CoA carboxylase biotin carboxylase subunit family protein, partial [Micromonospora sp. ATCC 39149]|uniref:ATP-grasp domain-containing protein n=1 Tax=Micromonospora sp. (strain ATCC 39149 / NRRL 15099 / SCC 1413) TaxID=219305 RepID=UPI0035103249
TTTCGRRHPAGPSAATHADNVITAETNDPQALLEHVARLHAALRFDGVLTSCDYYLHTAAAVAAHLGLPGPDPEAVRRAYRKDLAREAMRQAGLPGPAFAVTDGWAATVAAADQLGYPLVVKPVDLCAGMYVRAVADPAQLRVAYDALAGFGGQRAPAAPGTAGAAGGSCSPAPR